MLIDDMPEKDAIELIWFKLLVYAGRTNNHGLFLFKDTIAYTDEMLASIFHRPLNIVRLAMQTFLNLQMIEQIDGVYSIPNWDKYQKSLDAYEKKKERDRENSKNYREKQKLLLAEKAQNKKSSDESSDVSRFCSYSYSNNNNINNMLYILNNTDYKNKDYILNNKEVYECIYGWLDYKDHKKPKTSHHYDTERGLTNLFNQFTTNCQQYGIPKVIDVVEKSIAANYAGVTWDWLKKENRSNGHPRTNEKRYDAESVYGTLITDDSRDDHLFD